MSRIEAMLANADKAALEKRVQSQSVSGLLSEAQTVSKDKVEMRSSMENLQLERLQAEKNGLRARMALEDEAQALEKEQALAAASAAFEDMKQRTGLTLFARLSMETQVASRDNVEATQRAKEKLAAVMAKAEEQARTRAQNDMRLAQSMLDARTRNRFTTSDQIAREAQLTRATSEAEQAIEAVSAAALAWGGGASAAQPASLPAAAAAAEAAAPAAAAAADNSTIVYTRGPGGQVNATTQPQVAAPAAAAPAAAAPAAAAAAPAAQQGAHSAEAMDRRAILKSATLERAQRSRFDASARAADEARTRQLRAGARLYAQQTALFDEKFASAVVKPAPGAAAAAPAAAAAAAAAPAAAATSILSGGITQAARLAYAAEQQANAAEGGEREALQQAAQQKRATYERAYRQHLVLEAKAADEARFQQLMAADKVYRARSAQSAAPASAAAPTGPPAAAAPKSLATAQEEATRKRQMVEADTARRVEHARAGGAGAAAGRRRGGG